MLRQRRCPLLLLSLFLSLALLARCAGGDGSTEPTPDADGVDAAADSGGLDVAAPADVGPADVGPADVAATDVPALQDTSATDTPTVEDDVPIPDAGPSDTPVGDGGGGPPRRYTFRAIAGVSMGGAAAMVAAQDISRFDLVGSLGGYVDITYLHHLVTTQTLGGFCPMEQILANIEGVDDPTNPDVWCGPVPPEHEWERTVDFNHWYFSINGGTVDRDFYLDAFTDFACVFGSMAGYNPASPLMPPGMTRDWLRKPAHEQCATALVVDYPDNLNREYNPEGEYPLVTFCDGQTPIGCTADDPPLCGSDNPDYWDLMGWYDPTVPHTKPVRLLMAVDYNRNGKRDYAEPVVVNLWERFDDVGGDGCANERETGDGGCLPAGDPGPSPASADAADPNGDDYDPVTNPLGAERNWRWEVGEPFDDFGLDGVAAPTADAVDYGEANGVWDAAPQRANSETRDPRLLVQNMPLEELERVDWWYDGGRRDVLNSAVASLHAVSGLRARDQEVRYYEGYVGRPGSLFPDGDRTTYLVEMMLGDLTASAIGKNVHVVYGNPDATEAEIRLGDGGHVGGGDDVAFRFMTFFSWLGERWPDVDRETGGTVVPELSRVLTLHTDALDARYRFVVNLPPGYDDPVNADRRYPVLYFLHGLGQEPASGLGFAAVMLQQFMRQGYIPRFLIVLPDGRCCYRDSQTGLRECACESSDLSGHKRCIDPTCTGPHETCEWRDIPGARLDRECIQGSFYMNLQTDKWGGTDQLDVMRYGDALYDLMDWVDTTYRVREPAVLPTP